ncbi:hypothetical protein [Noviherbaspirillum cavernae]|nr:hypothetical protein [Noviherbaspirillum cavernae]
MVPWLKIANIWFDAANYPSSILAANEVLQREPANQEAKSLLVVAGLRVAAGAVGGLRSPNAVNPSARLEAENLTNSLRNVLGEKALVPAVVPETKQPAPPVRSRPLRAKASIAPVPNAAATNVNSSKGSADPFKSLK